MVSKIYVWGRGGGWGREWTRTMLGVGGIRTRPEQPRVDAVRARATLLDHPPSVRWERVRVAILQLRLGVDGGGCHGVRAGRGESRRIREISVAKDQSGRQRRHRNRGDGDGERRGRGGRGQRSGGLFVCDEDLYFYAV